MSPEDGAKLLREQPVQGIQLAHLGEFVADGFWLEEIGTRRRLEPKGWVHELG